MFLTKTIFTVQYSGVGRPPKLEAVDVVAASMEEAIDAIRTTYGHPRITLVQDKGQSVLVRV
jgi:hypothetical protein